MALVPSINLCVRSNCTQLVLRETTGVYSIANPGGYGAPNILTSDIAIWTLLIVAPDGTTYTLSNADLTGFPTSNTSYEFVIPMSLIGNRTKIEDGYWQFRYILSVNDFSNYTYDTARTFTCSINCCIDNMLSKIKLLGCDTCENLFTYEDYAKALALRDSLENATDCGDTDYIEDTIDVLTRLCNKAKCKTCN